MNRPLNHVHNSYNLIKIVWQLFGCSEPSFLHRYLRSSSLEVVDTSIHRIWSMLVEIIPLFFSRLNHETSFFIWGTKTESSDCVIFRNVHLKRWKSRERDISIKNANKNSREEIKKSNPGKATRSSTERLATVKSILREKEKWQLHFFSCYLSDSTSFYCSSAEPKSEFVTCHFFLVSKQQFSRRQRRGRNRRVKYRIPSIKQKKKRGLNCVFVIQTSEKKSGQNVNRTSPNPLSSSN